MRLVIPLLILVPLAASCGSPDDDTSAVVTIGSCSSFELEYAATHELAMPELDGPSWSIVDGAFGDGEIRVLIESRTAGASARPLLIRYDRAGKARLGELDVPLGGCTPRGLARANEGWVVLAACATAGAPTESVLSVEANGSTSALFSFGEPDAFQVSFDEQDDEYWIRGSEGVFSAPVGAAPQFTPVALEPLDWGPTSGFDHIGSTLVFARDAFEAGMSNMLAVQSDTAGERCQFRVEGAPGLSGVRGVDVLGHESTVWALTPRATLVEFTLTARTP